MTRTRSIALGAVLAGLLTGNLLVQTASATHAPANKMSVAASTLEEMETLLVEGTKSRTVTLLTGSMKTSSPTDLIFQLTTECALITDVVTVGDDDSSAVATVKVWVEVDGKPVGVTGADRTGEVVFCNRAFRAVTSGFEEDDEDGEDPERIELYQSTRSAHAFNWIKINLGKGIHTIAVKGLLEAQVTGTGKAEALIGKRTLVVEPTKLANDITI